MRSGREAHLEQLYSGVHTACNYLMTISALQINQTLLCTKCIQFCPPPPPTHKHAQTLTTHTHTHIFFILKMIPLVYICLYFFFLVSCYCIQHWATLTDVMFCPIHIFCFTVTLHCFLQCTFQPLSADYFLSRTL